MIRFQNKKTNFVVAFRLYKPLTAEDVDELAGHLSEKLKAHRTINLYIEIDDSIKESFENVIEHFKLGLAMFLPNAERFQKIAIVTNKEWLRDITNTKEKFFAVDIKGFPINKKQEALNWVTYITEEVDIMSENVGHNT